MVRPSRIARKDRRAHEQDTWTKLFWRIKTCVPTNALEVYAIAKALELACENYREAIISVVIYSNSPGALEFFARLRLSLSELGKIFCGKTLAGPGIIATEELISHAVEVELQYVPGHSGIKGNLKADRAAEKGAMQSVKKQIATILVTE